MRISDWSSDGCSSDLSPQSPPAPPDTPSARRERPLRLPRRSAPWPDRLWCRGTLPLAPPRHQHHSDRVSIRSLVKMGIFSRTRDIIAANVTDLLDRAEDPEKMIRQNIIAMNETLVEVRASAARTIADQKEMHRHHATLDSRQERGKRGEERRV